MWRGSRRAGDHPMKVLVTGADGFVGRFLVRRLVAAGHEVGAAVRRGGAPPGVWLSPAEARAVARIDFELDDTGTAETAAAWGADGVVHLAAVASSREAR